MYPKIVVTPNYFPTQWCDNINTWILKNIDPDPNFGTKGVRKCTVRMLSPKMKPYEGVLKSMFDYARQHIKRFDVDIDYNIDGCIQHITYNPGDYVGWHNDLMDINVALAHPKYKDLKTNRKLSMTVMLSNPSDYTGGEFIFDNNIKLQSKVEGKGTTALFTSYTQHKVETINSGVRNILFIFMTGPQWR